jgi:hypothetical protein
MMKTQIGLGVLSIPAAFDTLGLIPGIISLLAIGLITLWSGYMVGVFKMKHPEVYGIEDVGWKIFGRTGREVLGLGFALCGSLPYENSPWRYELTTKQSGHALPVPVCWESPLASTRFRNMVPALPSSWLSPVSSAFVEPRSKL